MPFYKTIDDAIVMDDATFAGAASGTLQAIVSLAITSGLPLVVRPGVYDATNVSITGPVAIRGIPGKVTFRMTAGAVGIFYLGAFTKAEFYGLIFDGANAAFTNDPALQPAQGLVNLRRDSGTLQSKAVFERCSFINSNRSGIGVNECRLLVTNCEFSGCTLKSIGVMATDETQIRDSRFENQDHAIHFSPGAATNVVVEGNIVRKCRRNGIAFEPAGTVKINRNITVRDNKIGKLAPADTWAVSRTDMATTGAEGNGVLAYLSENVVISGNEIADCEFSAIRTNVASQVSVSDNVCRGSGETALYVETVGISVGEFGATVTGNVVYGGGAGISVVNFDFNGKFSTVAGNIVRDVNPRTITHSGGTYGTGGVGIYVEGDASVSGNTVENAYFGLAVGTNAYARDICASGNVLRNTTLGIGASGSAPKEILISGNLIAGYASGAIKAFSYSGVGTPPFAITGAELCPANRGSAASGNIHMIGNVRRAVL